MSNLEFALDKIKILEFSERDPEELAVVNTPHKLEDKLEIEITAIPSTNAVNVKMSVKTISHIAAEPIQVCSLECVYKFLLKDYVKNFGDSDKVVEVVPDFVLINFLFMTIGGVRGILVAKCKSKYLENHILPPVDPAKILERLKST
jgi:hypothetical protein